MHGSRRECGSVSRERGGRGDYNEREKEKRGRMRKAERETVRDLSRPCGQQSRLAVAGREENMRVGE